MESIGNGLRCEFARALLQERKQRQCCCDHRRVERLRARSPACSAEHALASRVNNSRIHGVAPQNRFILRCVNCIHLSVKLVQPLHGQLCIQGRKERMQTLRTLVSTQEMRTYRTPKTSHRWQELRAGNTAKTHGKTRPLPAAA